MTVNTDTSSELCFTEIVENPRLSAADILFNLAGWINSSINIAGTKKYKNMEEYDYASCRRQALVDVEQEINRLGGLEF